jgi:hypothetical protein
MTLSYMSLIRLLAICAVAAAFRPSVPRTPRHTRCAGAKTDAVVGALRRVPLAGRLFRSKAAPTHTPPPAPAPECGSTNFAALLDTARDEAASLLEDVVRREVGDLADRGLAVPFEAKAGPPSAAAWRAACDASGVMSYADFGVTLAAPEAPEAPAEKADPVAAFDAAHAAGGFEELLVSLRDASRAASELDAAVEWRYARACLDVADARGDATREGLVREGLEAARRSAALAPADGLAQKWLGIMLGSVGDYETTKEKLGNSYAIKDALDVAWAARPDDATVALALGQWCLKVAGVSFVERGLARAIFGGSPPTATFAEALAYFQRADKLRPAPKTKALIKLVQKKMK